MLKQSNNCKDYIPLARDFYSPDELIYINNLLESRIPNIGNISLEKLDIICKEYLGGSTETILKNHNTNLPTGHALVTNRDVIPSNSMSRQAIDKKISQLLDDSLYKENTSHSGIGGINNTIQYKIKKLIIKLNG